ncbi:hypothetical protein HanXRQr2_Chr16g0729911 [Helianthus annuus]|uniref:Uncharacterized protein n=1 Tax=Helianthus annuus TaxID=4232 RepID=A0A9K3DQN8_HELAN|nr:hypothetical protein HanXRQr2_Chr16g0729911 [Helianthus annuus]KAJ0459136.1 hypothetical protein HanHA89_Chr16g0645501 [Helianthus annuus]KAJ0639692.1 hypothetical protein HanLR1_Chr16g0606631 [Helianthus annuus]
MLVEQVDCTLSYLDMQVATKFWFVLCSGSAANMTPLTCAFANSILIFVHHDTNALMCDSGLNSTKNVIYHFQARFTIPKPLKPGTHQDETFIG